MSAPVPPPRAALGLGMAALGRPGYMTVQHHADLPDTSVEAMRRNAFDVLDAAYAGGVRHVDCARSYGLAEDFLAAWLDARGVRDVRVSSKWGYRYTAEWRSTAAQHEVKELTLAHFRSQLEETRARLGRRLDVYQVHSATLESGVLADGALLDALAGLRDEGVEVGLSVTGERQADVVRAALDVRRDGRPLFGWVQATWNVLERSAESALREAAQSGARVIVKEALANGRLTSRGDVPLLEETAAALGVTPDALALAAALSRPWASVVLSGATTRAQLESNLRAAAVTVDGDVLRELEEPARDYWARRARLPWT